MSSLYIDWHDDAVNLPSWFPDMLVKEDWKKVAQKLVSLEAQLGFKTNNDHLKVSITLLTLLLLLLQISEHNLTLLGKYETTILKKTIKLNDA